MVGWWIVIAKQPPVGSEKNIDYKNDILATWEASVFGLDWIKLLVQDGKATQLRHSGYPNQYVVLAGHVLPLIENGPPPHDGPTIIGDDYVMQGNWIGSLKIDHDRLHQCAPDQPLIIDAWDLS
jgi:hypothetical protein